MTPPTTFLVYRLNGLDGIANLPRTVKAISAVGAVATAYADLLGPRRFGLDFSEPAGAEFLAVHRKTGAASFFKRVA